MSCSNCLPQIAFDVSCEDKSAGGNLTTLYYIPRCQLTADPYTDTYNDGIIDDIAVDGNVFYQVEAIRDSVTLTQTTDPIGRRVNQQLTFKVATFGGSSGTKDEKAQNAVDFYQDMLDSKEGLVFVVEGRDGIRRIVGQTVGLELDESTYESLATREELPGFTMNFSQLESGFAKTLSKDYSIPTT